ncbi:MAG: outer membrane protein transport protein [Gemmatimonadales bacterium]
MRRKAVVLTAALLAATGLSASRASAQGFSVYEHDACAMGRAGAGVAAPCSGGSAIFFNPAGIVTGQAGKWNIAAGVTMIPPRGSFTDSVSGTTTDMVKNNIPVPDLYITHQLSSRLALGVGMFAPYGLTTEWPASFIGHFLSYKSTIASIYLQPTVAYKVSPRIQVGVGVDFVRTMVDLHQYVELSSQLAQPGVTFAMLGVPVGTAFADARIHGDGNATGFHVGVILKPTDNLSIGARYMSGVTITGSGYAGFTQLGTGITLAAGNPFGAPAKTPLDALLASQFSTGALVTQAVSATLPMPAQAVVGVAFAVRPDLRLFGDVQWTQWSKFVELPLTFTGTSAAQQLPADTLYEGYKDTYDFRVSAEYTASPKLTLRAGFLSHNAASPSYTVTPILPEGARAQYILGAGYQFTPGIRLDLAYQIVKQQDRRGRVIEPPTRGADVNQGLYKLSANLFGASVAFAF